ncbi:MAG: ABC transporter ATP-binding protein, partial [Pirellulales bacterium]
MIELVDVGCKQGSFTLQGINLQIHSGEYCVLMGRTGRGKTTLLELICGLRRVSSGTIRLNDRDVTRWAPGDRLIGYVPQDLALFTHLNVREHLSFALKLRRRPQPEINDRVEELAGWLGLEPLLKRSVAGLSGGESQRVALGRAIAIKPTILLLDEPLSALDVATRQEM